MSLFGRNVALVPGIGARRTQIAVEFDDLWDEQEGGKNIQEEKDVPKEPIPSPVAPAVREPTQKEILSGLRLYGDKMSETEIVEMLKKKFARAEELQQPQGPVDERQHISSEEVAQPRPSQHWDQRHYQGQEAISSEQLFPQERRVGFRENLWNTLDGVARDFNDASYFSPPPNRRNHH